MNIFRGQGEHEWPSYISMPAKYVSTWLCHTKH